MAIWTERTELDQIYINADNSLSVLTSVIIEKDGVEVSKSQTCVIVRENVEGKLDDKGEVIDPLKDLHPKVVAVANFVWSNLPVEPKPSV
jgi:hypothetical protein